MGGLGFLRELAQQKMEPSAEKEKVKALQNTLEREVVQDERTAMRAAYAKYLNTLPLEKNTILYESFGGRGMICNPYALFKYLLSCRQYRKYTHIWVIEDFEDNALSMAEYDGYTNVKFVKYMSDEYLKALAASGYLINNVSFPGFFVKRKGQVYLNTWHGSPMKTMGFDIPGGNISSGNSARNLLCADYLISASPYMTEKAYLQSYKMQGIYEGTILENGFPRNDIFFCRDKERIVKKLQDSGVCVDPDKKLILYAPTWKGEKYASPDTSLEEYFHLIDSIEKSVDPNKYQVLVKAHQIIYYHIKNSDQVTEKFIPATLDTNEILSIVDVLISDYSSIHFDFLVSGRPMVFFIPDLDEFTGYRGLYFGTDELPGPVIKDYEELERCFSNLEEELSCYKQKYEQEKQWAAPRDDGNVCKRIAETVFEKKKSGVEISCAKTTRKKLLLYAGDLKNSELTQNLLAFWGVFDLQKLDVTLLVQSSKEAGCEKNIEDIPKQIRVLYWKPFYVADTQEYARHLLMDNIEDGSKMCVPNDFYRRELKRAVGDSTFDYAAAFSLDCSVFLGILSVMEKTCKIIWMNQKWDKSSWIYKKADRIVAVSKEMALSMGGPAIEKYIDKCCYIENPVNLHRIAYEDQCQTILNVNEERQYIAMVREITNGLAELETVELPDPNVYNFAAWGELDENSHYDHLLEAFGELCQNRENVHLYIIGTGNLREKLEKTVKNKKMCQQVSFCGNLGYPIPFIRSCDCMVQESEMGEQSQKMLLAKSLGLSCIWDYSRLADFSDKKLMKQSFDSCEYNSQVQKELGRLFEV